MWRTRAVAAAVVCAAFGTGRPVVAEPAPVAQPCTAFAASPAFAADRTAFCAGEVRDVKTGSTTGVAVFATGDSGRTWQQATAVGLVVPPESRVLRDLQVSPQYASDRAVYLQLSSGLFVSVDRGTTFLPVDPFAGGRLTPFSVAAPAGGSTTGHALLAHALRGDVEGANRSAIIDPITRARTPVKGSPGLDTEFAVSPGFAKDGLAYVMAVRGIGLTRRFQLYGCSVALECSTPLHQFPARWNFDRMWLAPDFPASRTIYVSIRPLDGPHSLWWSRDGGRTFTRWTSAQRLLPPRAVSLAFGLAGVPGTRQLYLRVTGDSDTTGTYEQLFLSRDGGASWTRISYGRTSDQRGPRGSMPPARPYGALGDGDTPRGMITAVGGGRLFMLGATYDRPNLYRSLFCTADHGRTWARHCPR